MTLDKSRKIGPTTTGGKIHKIGSAKSYVKVQKVPQTLSQQKTNTSSKCVNETRGQSLNTKRVKILTLELP